MDNVKGKKIHLRDNLLNEVGTQVGLYSKEDCLVPKYPNSCCNNLDNPSKEIMLKFIIR